MNVIYLSLGSNIGNRKENLLKAVKLIQKNSINSKVSNIYETEPIGYKDQNDFLNCALRIETNIEPKKLIKKTQEIEKELLRKKTFEKGPRTIDIDIIEIVNYEINSEELTIPHPGYKKRLFVLIPLLEVVEEFELKSKVKTYLKKVKTKEKVKIYSTL